MKNNRLIYEKCKKIGEKKLKTMLSLVTNV